MTRRSFLGGLLAAAAAMVGLCPRAGASLPAAGDEASPKALSDAHHRDANGRFTAEPESNIISRRHTVTYTQLDSGPGHAKVAVSVGLKFRRGTVTENTLLLGIPQPPDGWRRLSFDFARDLFDSTIYYSFVDTNVPEGR